MSVVYISLLTTMYSCTWDVNVFCFISDMNSVLMPTTYVQCSFIQMWTLHCCISNIKSILFHIECPVYICTSNVYSILLHIVLINAVLFCSIYFLLLWSCTGMCKSLHHNVYCIDAHQKFIMYYCTSNVLTVLMHILCTVYCSVFIVTTAHHV